MTEYEVIDRQEDFAAAAASLAAGHGPVAVDVERASGFRYSQRAYLVQVFRRDAGLFLFDPPPIGDFTLLQEAIGDVEWVLHAASQDLPSLRELDLSPATIFDTELAARLLGHERVGLGAVVESTLGISLAKAHSAADWSTRPLPQSWLEYAALDVAHLIDVRDALDQELQDQQKSDIAAEEFAAVLARLPKPPREDPWRRLSGLHTVRGRQSLAIARELWTAREDFARAEDVSPGRLVPDRALVAAIRANPKTKRELGALKDFTGRASRTQLDRWWDAIERGRSAEILPPERIQSDTLPPPRAWVDRNPAADARLKNVRPKIEELAEALGMPTENLLTPDTLRRLAWSPPEPLNKESIAEALAAAHARQWQIAQTAQVIASAFVDSVQSAEPTPESSS
ncbi:ribonuclease D [Microbacterium endophyticum]|uniref:Ribonuclease D n=1 Tax=Microbacterium endophyticum TaxID=1526412 RepID=A0A7W4V522_9MICO|nr:HRDC domain-containing protein [Microbacterium endophyticum]MBB2976986.1 ribonuclease D [Microbacterium endophyticum]NIK36728.1 ribonuclease D [Microbacterium endophyticum]